MNIKEIALLAGVSASTVSKIINKKDGNISRETRDRVLRIVKENNYRPYSDVQFQGEGNSFLIGVLVSARHLALSTAIAEYVRKEGYAVIFYLSRDKEQERINLQNLLSRHVDGVLWNPLPGEDKACESLLAKSGIPVQRMDFSALPDPNNIIFNYEALGYAATKCLVDHKHKNLFCLVGKWDHSQALFAEGFQKCLFDHKIPFHRQMVLVAGDKEEIPPEIFYGNSGAVCFSPALAGQVYRFSQRKNKRVPKYMSVVSLAEEETLCFLPELSVIRLPYGELGAFAAKRLIAKIEHRRIPEVPFSHSMQPESLSSVDEPILLKNRKIVVVGAVNRDTIISLKEFPRVGETTTAGFRMTLPGGKGLNQAVGAAKLGAEAYLIGKLGKDYEGGELFDFLQANDVNGEGVSNTSHAATGQAYIHVQQDGESGIVIYDGANGKLSPHDIAAGIQLFDNASFCLLQTELRMETVEAAAKAAWDRRVRVLLKPAAVSCLSDRLLQQIEVLLPNEKEINRLCPPEMGLEAQAEYFLHKGVKNVIITLGQRGCYWRDRENSRYFPAARFAVVDTTGAADAFAAALAVYLSKEHSMESAIRYATVAAGFSTTKRGVPPSLIDQSTLEFYMTQQDKVLFCENN